MGGRLEPMKSDKNDERALRDVTFGHTQYGATAPMFFSRYGVAAPLEGQYYGASCFLVSNGPSLRNVDLSLLRKPGVMTITVNNGPAFLMQNGITPSFWVCVDHPSRFIKQIWMNPAITKFVPLATLQKPMWDNEEWKATGKNVMECPNVYGIRRNEKFAAHRFWTESNFNWGCHKDFGGCRTVLLPAMRIPYVLGFRKLYLLGVDLDMAPDKTYSFDEGRTKGAISNNQHTYKRIIEDYGPGIKKYADPLGYEICNCNPTSKLTCFPQKTLEEAVAEATAGMGPTDKIQTKGMYVEWEKKQGLTREQAQIEVDTRAQ